MPRLGEIVKYRTRKSRHHSIREVPAMVVAAHDLTPDLVVFDAESAGLGESAARLTLVTAAPHSASDDDSGWAAL